MEKKKLTKEERDEVARRGQAAIEHVLSDPQAPADPQSDAKVAEDIARYLDLDQEDE